MTSVASVVLCVVQTEQKGSPARQRLAAQGGSSSGFCSGSGRQRESHWEKVSGLDIKGFYKLLWHKLYFLLEKHLKQLHLPLENSSL